MDQLIEVLEADDSAIGFGEVAESIIAVLARQQPTTVCIVGSPGSGRTTLLRHVQARLGPSGVAGRHQLLRPRLESALLTNRAEALRAAGRACTSTAILALDDLDALLMLVSPAIDLEARSVVRSFLDDPDLCVIVTLEPDSLRRLEREEPEMYGELEIVQVPSLTNDELLAVCRARAMSLSRHHELPIEATAIDRAISRPQPSDRRSHPALAIERLDAWAATAKRVGGTSLGADDVGSRAGGGPIAIDPDVLAERLTAHVVGQDHAVVAITRRLGLTTKRLDLRPNRPNGVFLMVGPSGVGKTQLAKTLAESLSATLIRLDMSEYSEDWSVSRLYGPHPGYLGSDRPDGWLTSQVIASPRSVILLDEIEKAHPKVWTAFLQVFDDGRMTDSTGRTAEFSDTVILMTSNIGARSFHERPVGFVTTKADPSASVLDEVHRLMPPEFVNRFDEIVVFSPLDEAAIRSIAALELERVVQSTSAAGWQLDISDEVTAWIASVGHDPMFGARHLHRNIERHLLQPLAQLTPARYTADLIDGSPRWRAVP